MVRKIQILLALLVLSNGAYSNNCNQACQRSVIENYFERLSVIYREGSGKGDIEQLFKLFHQDVKYEHIEYGAKFNLSDWKVAFMNNVKRGAYSAGEKDGMRVENYIYGKRHVAVEYSYGQISSDGKWQPKGDQKLFALFAFNDDQIELVREYW